MSLKIAFKVFTASYGISPGVSMATKVDLGSALSYKSLVVALYSNLVPGMVTYPLNVPN